MIPPIAPSTKEPECGKGEYHEDENVAFKKKMKGATIIKLIQKSQITGAEKILHKMGSVSIRDSGEINHQGDRREADYYTR